MPTLTSITSGTVDQAGYDESGGANNSTCFGLPGSGGRAASMSSCHFTVYLAVYDNDFVYITIGGQISDPVSGYNPYDVKLVVSASQFSWVNNGGRLSNTAGVDYATAAIDATDGSASAAPYWASGKTAYEASYSKYSTLGWFVWNLPSAPAAPSDAYPDTSSGWKLIGHLSDFGAGPDGVNGQVWISGTGTYSLDDIVGPIPVAVTVPGFIVKPVDYYPFAIRKGSWASANREGGCTQIRKTSWRDAKNSEGDGTNAAFNRSGGNWVKAPKL